MKRLIAKRKLKFGCDQCRKPILKGHIYYRKRNVFTEDSEIFGYTLNYCPKCKYENKKRELRFENFKKKCTHPEEFINTVYTYIPGEAVKEPSHSECGLCGNILQN